MGGSTAKTWNTVCCHHKPRHHPPNPPFYCQIPAWLHPHMKQDDQSIVPALCSQILQKMKHLFADSGFSSTYSDILALAGPGGLRKLVQVSKCAQNSAPLWPCCLDVCPLILLNTVTTAEKIQNQLTSKSPNLLCNKPSTPTSRLSFSPSSSLVSSRPPPCCRRPLPLHPAVKCITCSKERRHIKTGEDV